MKDVLDLTKKLISIPSIAGNTTAMNEVLEVCEKILNQFPSKKFFKNGSKSVLYFNTKNLPKKFRLILNAHLDVVAGNEKQFKPFVSGDKLFGRGANDMKAAAAVFVILFSKLAKNLDFPLALQLVTDEEVGGFSGTGFQTDQGIKTDFIIAGEPTNMLINNEAKGVLWVEFTIKGKSAHSAYVWNGDNAIVKTFSLINLLLKNFPSPKTEKWKTTCNIAKIETKNDAINKVPDYCRLVVDIRYVPGDLKKVKDIISKFENSFTSVKYLEESSSSFSNKNNKNIKLLRKVLINNGQPDQFIKKHGSSDVRFYNALGIPGITFGPIGAGLHGDNEWVSLKSLSNYYKIINDYLLSSYSHS